MIVLDEPSPKRRRVTNADREEQEPGAETLAFNDNDNPFANDDLAPYGGDFDFGYMRRSFAPILFYLLFKVREIEDEGQPMVAGDADVGHHRSSEVREFYSQHDNTHIMVHSL